MAYRKYNRKASGMKPRARRAPRRARNTFNKRVLAVIKKQTEDKMAYSSNSGVTMFNSGINSNADCQRIVPNISNGNTDYQRIGDQIRAQSFRLKGYLEMAVDPSISGSSASNRRLGVRMMVVTPKSFQNVNFAEANSSYWLPSLLKKGGTSVGFSGAVSDLFAEINTDIVTVHYNKVSYMTQPVIYGTLQGMLDISKTVKFFNINIKCKNKLLKYDANIDSALTPVNFAPILLIGYCLLDGTSPDTLSTRVGCMYETIFKYEDA